MKPNAVICYICKTVVESTHVHDFRPCNCKGDNKRVCVDGGKEYQRRVVGDDARYSEIQTYEELERLRKELK